MSNSILVMHDRSTLLAFIESKDFVELVYLEHINCTCTCTYILLCTMHDHDLII